MPQLRLVDHPDRSPTRCFVCHGHEGPMVDVLVDQMEVAVGGQITMAEGAVFICVRNENSPGCLVQMARLAGISGVDAREHAHTRADLARALGEVHRLRYELAQAQEQAKLTVADVYGQIEANALVSVGGSGEQPRRAKLNQTRPAA